MSADYRPLGAVPRAIWIALILGLAAQLAWRVTNRPGAPAADELPPAPSARALRLASFGEPQAAARLAMLYLQSFDSGGEHAVPYSRLDYGRLVDWLGAIQETDPR